MTPRRAVMSGAMFVALIGVLGVLLGALLNALGSYISARRAERRDLRTAARILLPELQQNVQNLSMTFRLEDWKHAELVTQRWAQHELTVVKALGGEWAQLVAVYTAFGLLNADREIRLEEGWHKSQGLEGDDFDYLELTLKSAKRALQALRKWAGLGPKDSIRIQEYFCV